MTKRRAITAIVGWHIRALDLDDLKSLATLELNAGAEADQSEIWLSIAQANRESPREVIDDLLWPLVSSDFDLAAHDSVARDLWLGLLKKYVQGVGYPKDVCGAVHWIEEAFGHPAWVGGMYDACDWSSETATREDWPQIEEEAIRILVEYSAPRPPQKNP